MGQKRKLSASETKKRYRDTELPKLFVMNENKKEKIESTTMMKINNHWKKISLLRKEIKECIPLSPEGIFARWLLQDNGYDKDLGDCGFNAVYIEAWDDLSEKAQTIIYNIHLEDVDNCKIKRKNFRKLIKIEKKAINRLYNFAEEASDHTTSSEELTQQPRQYSPSHPLGCNPKQLCCICGDTAIHKKQYGVYVCVGCRDFFSNASNKAQYKQKKTCQKKCKIVSHTQNKFLNCSYCRYQKCLQMGMDKYKTKKDSKDKVSEKDGFMENSEDEVSEKDGFMENSEDEVSEKDGLMEDSEDEVSEKDGLMEDSEDEESNMPSSSSSTEKKTDLQKYMESDKFRENKSLKERIYKLENDLYWSKTEVNDLLVIKRKLESHLQVCQDKSKQDLEKLRNLLETERASHEEYKSCLAISSTSHQECIELTNEKKECQKVKAVSKLSKRSLDNNKISDSQRKEMIPTSSRMTNEEFQKQPLSVSVQQLETEKSNKNQSNSSEKSSSEFDLANGYIDITKATAEAPQHLLLTPSSESEALKIDKKNVIRNRLSKTFRFARTNQNTLSTEKSSDTTTITIRKTYK